MRYITKVYQTKDSMAIITPGSIGGERMLVTTYLFDKEYDTYTQMSVTEHEDLRTATAWAMGYAKIPMNKFKKEMEQFA